MQYTCGEKSVYGNYQKNVENVLQKIVVNLISVVSFLWKYGIYVK